MKLNDLSYIDYLVKLKVCYEVEVNDCLIDEQEVARNYVRSLSKNFNRDTFIFVIGVNDFIASMCTLKIKRQKGKKIGYTTDMYTLPKYRCRGFMRILKEEATKFAIENGCTKTNFLLR